MKIENNVVYSDYEANDLTVDQIKSILCKNRLGKDLKAKIFMIKKVACATFRSDTDFAGRVNLIQIANQDIIFNEKDNLYTCLVYNNCTYEESNLIITALQSGRTVQNK